MPVDMLNTGGQLVQPDGILDASLAIDGEEIAAVGAESDLPEADVVVDVSGKLVLPGAVDVYVHLDDHFSNDTYETASKAAVLGGTTTFVDFAWQAWVGDVSLFDEKSTLIEGVDRKQARPNTRSSTTVSTGRSLARTPPSSRNCPKSSLTTGRSSDHRATVRSSSARSRPGGTEPPFSHRSTISLERHPAGPIRRLSDAGLEA